MSLKKKSTPGNEATLPFTPSALQKSNQPTCEDPRDTGVILLVPTGKIRCYVHDSVLRNDTPEEHVRQRVARSLVDEYGYDRNDIHLEFPIKIGSGKKKRVDIAIFPPGSEHKQEHIIVIVEAKREDVRPTDRELGIEQLKSYMASCLNDRWGLWVGSEMVALEKEANPRKATENRFLEATDIPLKGATEPKRLEFSDLVPATGAYGLYSSAATITFM